MCWLPIDQPLLLPGDFTCSGRRLSPCSVAQLLASRLRRIGDQLEKSWTAGERRAGGGGHGGHGGHGGGFSCGGRGGTAAAAAAAAAGRGHLKSFLRSAMHFTVLVLVVARRHL